MASRVTPQDRQDFHDLALAYARSADRRDYEAFRNIFAKDGLIGGHTGDPASTPPQYEMKGIEKIVRGLRGLEQYSRTLHLVSNQYIFEIDGDTASGETYCVAHHISEKDGAEWDHVMYIRYQDRYARPDAHWRFSERRLWVEFTSDAPLVAS